MQKTRGGSLKQSKQAQNSYEVAFNKAAAVLRARDPDQVNNTCGTSRDESRIILPFFNQELAIKLPKVEFNPPTISLYEQILILHYLTTFGKTATKGEYVSFKNLPGASFYNPTYRKRGPERILKAFGNNVEKIVEASEVLGGSRAEYGDVSVKLDVFPKIKAIVVLYRSDDEFPPEANILYNDDIINYLPLEDIAVLSGIIAGRLKKAVSI